MGQDFLCLAPEQDALYTTSAMRRHHDQVTLSVLRSLDNGFVWVVAHHVDRLAVHAKEIGLTA